MWKRALQYVQLVVMDMKNGWVKNMNMQEKCKNSNQVQKPLSKKNDSPSHKGRTFLQYQKQIPVN